MLLHHHSPTTIDSPAITATSKLARHSFAPTNQGMLGPTRLIRDDIISPVLDDFAFHPLYAMSSSSRRPSSQGSCSPRSFSGAFSPATVSESEFSSGSSTAYSTPSVSPGFRHSIDNDTRLYRSELPAASVQILRCLRCARTVEATSTDDASTVGMVRIAHNLHYCNRCAKMVGYGK